MKEFNLQEFRVDGTIFFEISLTFDYVSGFRVLDEQLSVTVRSGIAPANGCDFNGGGYSLSSKSFLEYGMPEITMLDISKYRVSSFAYVLPENFEQLRKQYIQHFLKQVSDEYDRIGTKLVEMQSKLQTARSDYE